MADDPLAKALSDLADRVERLAPQNHDPESYFVERDGIWRALKKLAAEASPKRIDAPAPKGRFTPGPIDVDGRRIAVERRGHRKAVGNRQ